MKKIIYHLIPFFVLLFLFVPDVNALELSIPDSSFDVLSSDNFLALKSYGEEKISSNSTYNGFDIIYYNSSDFQLAMYKQYTDSTIYLDTNNPYVRYDVHLANNNNKLIEYYRISNNVVSLSSSNNASIEWKTYAIVYSNNNPQYRLLYHYQSNNGSHTYDTNETLLLNFLGTSDSVQYGEPFPSLYDLYEMRPQDDMSLLSSFFSLTIEKLQYITEYFSSNVIYLSIFVIFIIVSIILIIKRRLF